MYEKPECRENPIDCLKETEVTVKPTVISKGS